MDEIVDATDTVRPNVSSAPGRPTDPTIIIAEAFVEALAALDSDRLLIRRTKRAVCDIYRALNERDAQIVSAEAEIRNGYRVAEAQVVARKQKAVA